MKKFVLSMMILMALLGCQSIALDDQTSTMQIEESTDLPDMKLGDDLRKGAQKVYKVIKTAHEQQRELTDEENSLVQDFLAKYKGKGNNFKEQLLVLDIERMSLNMGGSDLYKQASTEAEKILNGTIEHVTPLE